MQVLDRACRQDSLERLLFDEDVEHRGGKLTFVNPQTTGSVPLGIEVEQHDTALAGGKASRQIYSGRSLADTSLLIRNANNSDHDNGEDHAGFSASSHQTKTLATALARVLMEKVGGPLAV